MAQEEDESKDFGPSIELLNDFLKNQSRQLANETEEIELRKLNEKNTFDFACRALELQGNDRNEERSERILFMKYGFTLTIFVIVLISFFIGGCIYTNNVQIIVAILKVVAYIIPSAIGGYFIGLNKGKEKSQKLERPGYEVVE